MDDPSRTTVHEVLRRTPRAAEVFHRRRMACVGCTMAPFDTVADAARAYGIDPVELGADLHLAVDGDGADNG